MIRARSPRLDKALDYRRTRRVEAEYPHAFRRLQPKLKQIANQQHRLRLRRALEDALAGAEELADVAPAAPRKSLTLYRITVALGPSVDRVLRQRARRVGWNHFNRGYDPESDREAAVAFFTALTAGRTPALREVALFWQAALDPPAVPARAWGRCQPERHDPSERTWWLDAFLRDQPGWEPRLRAWVEAVLALPPPRRVARRSSEDRL